MALLRCAALCSLLSVGLLMVGAWFVPAGWNEKIITWRPGLCVIRRFRDAPKRWTHRLLRKIPQNGLTDKAADIKPLNQH